jgi:hypothetical protein
MRAAFSVLLESLSPCTTASHTACAVLHSALLRNCTTVLNRDTRVNAHIKPRTVSRDTGASCCSGGGVAAAANTGMNEAKRAGSSEAPKSAGRDVGGIVCRPAMQKKKGQRVETESRAEQSERATGGGYVRSVEPSARRCLRRVCGPMSA